MQVYGEVEKVHKHPKSSKALLFLAHLTRKKKTVSVFPHRFLTEAPKVGLMKVWPMDPENISVTRMVKKLVLCSSKPEISVTCHFCVSLLLTLHDLWRHAGTWTESCVKAGSVWFFLNPVYKNDSQVFSSARAHTQVNAWTGGAAVSWKQHDKTKLFIYFIWNFLKHPQLSSLTRSRLKRSFDFNIPTLPKNCNHPPVGTFGIAWFAGEHSRICGACLKSNPWQSVLFVWKQQKKSVSPLFATAGHKQRKTIYAHAAEDASCTVLSWPGEKWQEVEARQEKPENWVL